MPKSKNDRLGIEMRNRSLHKDYGIPRHQLELAALGKVGAEEPAKFQLASPSGYRRLT
jgi:hypothetical protein